MGVAYILSAGRQKAAKTFNIEEIFRQTQRTAQEYSAEIKGTSY